MTKRQKLQAKADENVLKIKALKEQNIEIGKKLLLMSDDEQQYKEKVETISERVNGKKVKRESLIGRIYWKEDFKDEDTEQVITIERSQVVTVDGSFDW